MKRSDLDWSVLRGAISLFVICLIISAVLLGASIYYRDAMRSEYNNHQTRFRDISRKYLAVDQEERMVEQYYPRFVELYQRGIVGAEQRLNWLESLQAAGERVKLPSLRYQIDAQEQFSPEFPVATGAFQIFASTMKLDLGLLHEGDLFMLLGELNREARGIYSVSNCKLRRVQEQIKFEPERPNLNAQCELKWFTVNMYGREISL